MATFKERLSASGKVVLDARATNMASLTKLEVDNIVSNSKRQLLRIEAEIAQHRDISVESRDSLQPGGKDFNSNEYANKLYELKKKLRIARIEYSIAVEMQQEEFPENEEDPEVLSKEELNS